MGKMTRGTFVESNNHPDSPGDMIVSDVMGPFSTTGIDGSRYFVTYTDVYSRFCTVAMLKNKSEQFEHLKTFITMFSNQHSTKFKMFQSDNGGEYISHQVQDWFKAKGIHHRRTVPGNSQSNGMAERINRTLTDIALSLLSHAKIPKQCFPWAIDTAVHLYNRRPHSSSTERKTPFQALYGKIPDLKYLRVFGCTAYRHFNDNERSKQDFRAQKLIHIGYASHQKAYQLYDPVSRKIFSSRDADFDEDDFTYGFSRQNACRNTHICSQNIFNLNGTTGVFSRNNDESIQPNTCGHYNAVDPSEPQADLMEHDQDYENGDDENEDEITEQTLQDQEEVQHHAPVIEPDQRRQDDDQVQAHSPIN